MVGLLCRQSNHIIFLPEEAFTPNKKISLNLTHGSETTLPWRHQILSLWLDGFTQMQLVTTCNWIFEMTIYNEQWEAWEGRMNQELHIADVYIPFNRSKRTHTNSTDSLPLQYILSFSLFLFLFTWKIFSIQKKKMFKLDSQNQLARSSSLAFRLEQALYVYQSSVTHFCVSSLDYFFFLWVVKVFFR